MSQMHFTVVSREFTKYCEDRDCWKARGVSIQRSNFPQGQMEEIDRVIQSYPEYTDDDFVKEFLEKMNVNA